MRVNLKAVEAGEILLLASLASRASFMGMGVCITHDPLAQRNPVPGLVLYCPLQEMRTRVLVSRWWAGEVPLGESPCHFVISQQYLKALTQAPGQGVQQAEQLAWPAPRAIQGAPGLSGWLRRDLGPDWQWWQCQQQENDCCVPGESRDPRQPWELGVGGPAGPFIHQESWSLQLSHKYLTLVYPGTGIAGSPGVNFGR